MKIDFEKLPIFDPDPQRTAKETQAMLVMDGRCAYISGLPKDHCLGRIIDNDLRIDWANGWRWEQEDHAKRNNCKCEGCRKWRTV